ncbi:unnamed protein product [Brassicogethes aeneus]|uniref:Uncharacterized protein n=1 Tax=Brassicogethes aeneus TaxID=1431903 RepID=A0A9P0BFU5_BRAAE|nr:unnamed protein product [Brassicogethes aeneus]
MTDKKSEYFHPDGGYGWVIVTAIIFINVSLLILVPNFGLIFEDEFKEMGINAAQKSFLLHLNSAIFCVFGLFVSPFLKKFSFRQVGIVGATLMCSGIFFASFAHSYEALILCISICMGIGQGILMPATYLATNTYFKKKLTVAVSISVTGASIGQIFMPKIIVLLLENIGRAYTILVLFGISLTSLPCCLLMKPLEKPIIENMLPRAEGKTDSVYNETTVKKQEETLAKKLMDLFDVELLKQRSFMTIVVVLGLSFAAELNVVLMMQFILAKLAMLNKQDIATTIMFQYIGDILGRLAIPLISHCLKVPPKVCYSLALIFACFARTGLAVLYTSYYSVIFFCFCFGLSKGARAVFQSVIIPKFVTFNKLPVATGINMLFTGVATLILGPALGGVHDLSGSYVYSLHTTSIISMICILIWLLEWFFFTLRAKREQNMDETVEIS